jgi:O-antigen/teichoic acid export membrane protein
MRVAFICATLIAYACLVASLVGTVLAQLFDDRYAELIIVFFSVFVGLPSGVRGGLELACMQREELEARVRKSERVLIALGLITASGCVVGMLGEGQKIPLAIGLFTTVGAMLGAVCVLLWRPRNADGELESTHGRSCERLNPRSSHFPRSGARTVRQNRAVGP